MSRAPRPTLEAVARAAGVHRSTAARALNPKTRFLISGSVVDRIEIEAARLGYRRDTVASSLRTGRSRLIGVVLPDLDNPVFGPILQAIEETLWAEDYHLLIANGGMDPKRQSAAVDSLLERRVDGLILATAWRHDVLVARCLAEGAPLVLVDRAEDADRAASVVADDAAGMALAVDHLVALGHVRIGLLGGPEDTSTGHRRAEGFKAAMRAHGLEPFAVASAGFYSVSAGEAAASELFGSYDLTAVIASNDLLALGAIARLKRAGLSCPGDVSVVGYNDMPLVDMLDPALTTIALPKAQLGQEAARAVLRAANEPDAAPQRLELACRLVVRASTAAPTR